LRPPFPRTCRSSKRFAPPPPPPRPESRPLGPVFTKFQSSPRPAAPSLHLFGPPGKAPGPFLCQSWKRPVIPRTCKAPHSQEPCQQPVGSSCNQNKGGKPPFLPNDANRGETPTPKRARGPGTKPRFFFFFSARNLLFLLIVPGHRRGGTHGRLPYEEMGPQNAQSPPQIFSIKKPENRKGSPTVLRVNRSPPFLLPLEPAFPPPKKNRVGTPIRLLLLPSVLVRCRPEKAPRTQPAFFLRTPPPSPQWVHVCLTGPPPDLESPSPLEPRIVPARIHRDHPGSPPAMLSPCPLFPPGPPSFQFFSVPSL